MKNKKEVSGVLCPDTLFYTAELLTVVIRKQILVPKVVSENKTIDTTFRPNLKKIRETSINVSNLNE